MGEHRFQRDNDGLCKELTEFYDSGAHEKYQYAALEGTEYMPSDILYVDFNRIGDLENPEVVEETLGDDYVEFANLLLEPGGDIYECYAHLAVDLGTGTVYLVDPSDEPELLGSLAELLDRLGVR